LIGREANKSKNPAASNQLMSGWNCEEDNGTNMYREWMAERLVNISREKISPEEDLQEV
jgi:hypothetical protein